MMTNCQCYEDACAAPDEAAHIAALDDGGLRKLHGYAEHLQRTNQQRGGIPRLIATFCQMEAARRFFNPARKP